MLFSQSTEIQDNSDNVVLAFQFGTNSQVGINYSESFKCLSRTTSNTETESALARLEEIVEIIDPGSAARKDSSSPIKRQLKHKIKRQIERKINRQFDEDCIFKADDSNIDYCLLHTLKKNEEFHMSPSQTVPQTLVVSVTFEDEGDYLCEDEIDWGKEQTKTNTKRKLFDCLIGVENNKDEKEHEVEEFGDLMQEPPAIEVEEFGDLMQEPPAIEVEEFGDLMLEPQLVEEFELVEEFGDLMLEPQEVVEEFGDLMLEPQVVEEFGDLMQVEEFGDLMQEPQVVEEFGDLMADEDFNQFEF